MSENLKILKRVSTIFADRIVEKMYALVILHKLELSLIRVMHYVNPLFGYIYHRDK